VAAFLLQPVYDFHELFPVVRETLRVRNVTRGSEEVLRLRVYEKLQALVARGAVKKAGKRYSSDSTSLRAFTSEMTRAKVEAEEWRAARVRSAAVRE